MRKNVMMLLMVATLMPIASACTEDGQGETLEIDEEASSKADGALWYKLYTCNGGAAVLDVNGNERRNLQLVIRDPNIMKYFHDLGMVQLPYGATELILSGWTGRVDFSRAHGPVLYGQPYGGPGVFNRSDFSELIANYNFYQGGRFARIFRDGPGIKLQFGQIEGRGCAQTETYCPGDGFDCSTYCVDEYTEFVEKANWYFNDCN
jgi:hypothetical protein